MKLAPTAPYVVAVLCLTLCDCVGPRVSVVPARYLALGDSYTIGEGVPGRDRWPVQLVARLRQHQIAIAEPQIIAETGWTTKNLLSAIDAGRPQGPFELISLLIGVNNQYQGRGLDEYRNDLRMLLQRAVALAHGDASRVLVLSIPDWGVTPFALGRDRARIAMDIDRFNRACRDETEHFGGRYVDITAESRRAPDDPTLLARDGLHPSAKMYAAWAELVFPAALNAIKGSVSVRNTR